MIPLINLTPHAIVISYNGSSLEVPPSGTVARVETEEVITGTLTPDFPVTIVRRTLKSVTGIPDPENREAVYIVSSMVLEALKAAGVYSVDIVAPDTGPTAIRNEKGHVMAVTRLIGA